MIATFSDIMREWKRMCETMDEKYSDKCCDYCPLHDQNCGAIWEVNDSVDWDSVEKCIMQWSHENPPKVYPTIYEVLKNVFGLLPYERNIEDWARRTNLPEHLAKKLNINPVEEDKY